MRPNDREKSGCTPRAPGALCGGARLHLCGAQRPMPTRLRWRAHWHATASAGCLPGRHNSPSPPSRLPQRAHLATGIFAGFIGRSRAVGTASRAASFCLSSLSTVAVLLRSTRAVSRLPLALRRMSMTGCCTSGRQPRWRESRSKQPVTPVAFWPRERWAPRAVLPRLTTCAR
jgi:hypothetical protein